MNRSAIHYWCLSSLILIFISGCTTTPSNVSVNTQPIIAHQPAQLIIKPIEQKKKNKLIYGKASFYANMFQGRKTANGQIFDQRKFTAAHRSLAFGTKVKVTNISNHKSVIVTINDRGPFIRGRMIDLSKAAFKAIGNTRSGVLKVTIEILK